MIKADVIMWLNKEKETKGIKKWKERELANAGNQLVLWNTYYNVLE